VEAVDVFLRINGGQDGLLVAVLRKRQLHEDAVDGGVGVEALDHRQQVVLRHVLGHLLVHGVVAQLRRGLLLHRDVLRAVGTLADQDDGQPRPARLAVRLDQAVNLHLHVRSYIRGNFLAVDRRSAQCANGDGWAAEEARSNARGTGQHRCCCQAAVRSHNKQVRPPHTPINTT
jgi:hypothetical protein